MLNVKLKKSKILLGFFLYREWCCKYAKLLYYCWMLYVMQYVVTETLGGTLRNSGFFRYFIFITRLDDGRDANRLGWTIVSIAALHSKQLAVGE